MQYEIIAAMGEYMIIDSSTGKQYGHTVCDQNDGMDAVDSLYAMCRAMNVSEADLQSIAWIDELIANNMA